MRTVATPDKHSIIARNQKAFSLIELLVACAILSLILIVVFSVLSFSSQLWRQANFRTESFQNARLAFETVTRLLGQATLNTYFDYDDPNSPSRYLRNSELHFLIVKTDTIIHNKDVYGWSVFFQSPAKKARDVRFMKFDNLLNANGFYIEYSSDQDWLPDHVSPNKARSRFRLMQWNQATEDLKIFTSDHGSDWILLQDESFPLADNIVAFIIWPRESLQYAGLGIPDRYSYDSRHGAKNVPQPATANQLPPILQVAMVAIDETSAERLGDRLKPIIEDCLSGLFTSDSNRPPSEYYSSDLETLELRLTEEGINHRTFNTAIPLRESKWSVDS
jgi:uncharacterized protein (TIGR02599 family)